MKFIKLVVFLVLVFVLLIIGLQFDDKLDPGAVTTISRLERNYESTNQAYLYLNGILASEKDSVVEVGRYRLHAYKAAEKYSNLPTYFDLS